MPDNPTGQDVTELVFGILARRVFDETLLGYIHEASKEIAGAISQASLPPQDEVERPFAYAYRYPAWPPEGATVIRFGTGGREINGAKPVETIPLYTRAALTASTMGGDEQ